jgi:nicotinamidase-related amidase
LPRRGDAADVQEMCSMLYDPKRTALVVIDLQSRIMGMSLGPYSAADVVDRTAAMARQLRSQGGTLVYVKVGFSEGFADALQQPVDAVMPRPPGARGTDGMDYAPAFDALPPEVWITKRQWSAFFGTELDLQLRRRGIETVIIAGIATNFGVEQTAREAWQHGYAVLIPADATTAVSEDMHRFAVEKIFPRIARVVSTEAVLANR